MIFGVFIDIDVKVQAVAHLVVVAELVLVGESPLALEAAAAPVRRVCTEVSIATEPERVCGDGAPAGPIFEIVQHHIFAILPVDLVHNRLVRVSNPRGRRDLVNTGFSIVFDRHVVDAVGNIFKREVAIVLRFHFDIQNPDLGLVDANAHLLDVTR